MIAVAWRRITNQGVRGPLTLRHTTHRICPYKTACGITLPIKAVYEHPKEALRRCWPCRRRVNDWAIEGVAA